MINSPEIKWRMTMMTWVLMRTQLKLSFTQKIYFFFFFGFSIDSLSHSSQRIKVYSKLWGIFSFILRKRFKINCQHSINQNHFYFSQRRSANLRFDILCFVTNEKKMPLKYTNISNWNMPWHQAWHKTKLHERKSNEQKH